MSGSEHNSGEGGDEARLRHYRWRAFGLTFIAYCSFHLTRKVPGVLKSTLHPQSATGTSSYDEVNNPGWAPFNEDLVPGSVAKKGYQVSGLGSIADGAFFCPTLEDEICEVYVARHDPATKLMLVPNEEFDQLDCPLFDAPENGTRCWVVSTTTVNSENVFFAQNSDGPLPAKASRSQGPKTVHWFRNSSNKFVKDDSLVAKPNTVDGGVLLGAMDSVFLAFYTIGLFVSGYLGDRVDARVFLTMGMVGSALCMFAMGLAYVWSIHSLGYFMVVNAMFGLFQSTGWPVVVSVMGSWYGHGNRGLIMGIWNIHTSLGNILGSLVTAASVGMGMHHEDWPLGYTVPGVLMLIASGVIFTFLVPHPQDVGLIVSQDDDTMSYSSFDRAGDGQDFMSPRSSSESLLESMAFDGQEGSTEQDRNENENAVLTGSPALYKPPQGILGSLKAALQIPGLIPFSLSLFFSKMCAYSVLYWGPYYLSSLGFTAQQAGYLCSFFDVGGVFGGIAAGFLSDRLRANGLVAFLFCVIGVPVLAFYYNASTAAGAVSGPNIALMILAGFFINAPYALITTAVSADLGTRLSGEGNERILSLVTGIIDGTGSFGAMIQGVVVGFISSSSWAKVWHFLMIAQGLSALMLVRLVFGDIKQIRARFSKNSPVPLSQSDAEAIIVT